MSAVNPYQPPRADVADIVDESAEFEEPSPLTWRGRIGRLRYLAYIMGAYLVMLTLVAASGAAAGVRSDAGAFGVIMLVVGTIGFTIYVYMVAIQRAHDIDWSGWMVLLLFLPLANLIVGLILLFKSGTKHRNRFGAPPTPNTWGVRILGGILPAIFIVGVLAAVTLPAYQDYTKRAQMQQGK